jgi:hypothetical protein
MQAQSLLESGAQFALRDPALIKLAATCTPSQAQKRARELGVQDSEAISCYRLAALRRDFPSVFPVLVAPALQPSS